MERPLRVGGEVVVVGAGLVHRSDPFGLSRSVQTYTVEILLGRIVRGRVVVEPTSRLVHHGTFDDVARAGCQESSFLAVARVDIGVPPAVLFAQHNECLAVADPLQPGILAVAGDDPCRIGFVEDAGDRTRADIGEEKLTLVSESAQLLHQQLIRIPGPVDLSEIETLCRFGNGEPACLASLGIDDTDTQRRDGLAHPGEASLFDFRIRWIARNKDRLVSLTSE